jgi:hypothetical protein
MSGKYQRAMHTVTEAVLLPARERLEDAFFGPAYAELHRKVLPSARGELRRLVDDMAREAGSNPASS